jgi:hypothetical protein
MKATIGQNNRQDTSVAMRKTVGVLGGPPDETLWYSVKRRLLGPPLVNAELGEQRLSKPLALGVLSPDGISSSAYGTEEILLELLPVFGLAAFTIILPMTGVVLFVMALVVLSYREVVSVYVRPGGSYVVARDNFGPRIAQVAAVALLVDYVGHGGGADRGRLRQRWCRRCRPSGRIRWRSPSVSCSFCSSATCGASARPGGRSRCPRTCSPAS